MAIQRGDEILSTIWLKIFKNHSVISSNFILEEYNLRTNGMWNFSWILEIFQYLGNVTIFAISRF